VLFVRPYIYVSILSRVVVFLQLQICVFACPNVHEPMDISPYEQWWATRKVDLRVNFLLAIKKLISTSLLG
jgi:hypothetical protein